jgi:glucose/mannose transport system permease protein
MKAARRQWWLRHGSRLGIYLALLAASAFYLLPVYVLVVTSLKPYAEANLAGMWHLPSAPSLESFLRAFEQLRPHFRNSFYLTIPATLLSSLLGSINGYVLSKWRFRGSEVLFPIMLFGMFIPYQSILIPLVQVLQKVNAAAEVLRIPAQP